MCVSMKKLWACGGLGIVTALVPFLGFPPSWVRVFTIVLGLAVAVLAFWAAAERGPSSGGAGGV